MAAKIDGTERAINHFGTLLATVNPTAVPSAPELSGPALATLLGGVEPGQKKGVLAATIAQHSSLTNAQAQHVAQRGLDAAKKAAVQTTGQAGAQPDAQTEGSAVSSAVGAATGLNADVELSDPVMLGDDARMYGGVAVGVALLLCIVAIYFLGVHSPPAPSGAYWGLGILGALSVIGGLVLIMGYKNVGIKVGQPAGGSSSSSGGNSSSSNANAGGGGQQ